MQDILNYGSKLATMQALETSKPHLLCVALALTLTIAGIVTYRNWAILISACLMVSAAVLIYSCTAINIAALFVFIAVLFLIAYFLMDI